MQNMYTFLQRTRALSWLIALLVLTATTAQAQVGNYVANSVTRAYVPLSSDSLLFTPNSVVTATSTLSGQVAIPAFNYGGTTFTRMSVNNNGNIQLHNGTVGLTSTTLVGTSTITNVITPLGMTMYGFMDATGTNLARVSIAKFGTAPALDSIVVQWSNMTRATPMDRISFQAILVYGTPGVVKFSYNFTNVATFSTSGPQIGVYGNSSQNCTMLNVGRSLNNFELFSSPNQSPNTTTPSASTLASAPQSNRPGSSLSYTFVSSGTIIAKNTSTTGSLSTTVSGGSYNGTISWGAHAAATAGFDWEIRSSGLPGSGATGLTASGSVAAGVNTATTTGAPLLGGVRYVGYYRSKQTAPAGVSGWYAVPATTPTALCTNVPSAITYVFGSATATGAQISFTPAGTAPASGYDWKVVARGAGPNGAAVASGNVSASPITITGLANNSTYEFYIRGNCGTSQSAWITGTAPFYIQTTTSTPISSLPYNEGFEGVTGDIGQAYVPAGWTTETNAPSTAPPFASFIYRSASTFTTGTDNPVRTGNVSMASRWQSGSLTNLWAPPVSLASGQAITISFWGRNTDGVSGYTFNILGNSSRSVTGATTLGTMALPTNTTWQQFVYNFTAPSAGTYHFCIQNASTNSAPNWYYFDDFNISNNPCGGAPTIGTTTGITNTTATINFTGVSGATDGYEYQLSTDGGTTWGITQTAAAGTGAQTISLSSLVGCTNYTIRMRSICSGGSQQSAWNTATFATTVGSGLTLPYSQGFEASLSLPGCTQDVITAAGATNNALAVFTASSVSGATITGGLGADGSNVLRFNSFSNTGGSARRFILPQFNMTGVTLPRVTFYIYNENSSTSGDSVNLTYSLNGGTTWIYTGQTIRRDVNNSGWTKYTRNIPAAAGQSNVLIGFIFTSRFGNNIYLDRIRVAEAPTCYEPASAALASTGVTTATGSWPAASPTPGVGYFYKLVTGSGSYAAGAYSGQQGITTSLTQNFGALVDGSTYTLWVRSYCGPGTSSTDSSDWVSASFTHVAPIAYSVTKSSTTFNSILGTGSNFTTFTRLGSFAASDEGTSSVTPIGFSFPYQGQTFTDFSITSNGELKLGSTLQSGTTFSKSSVSSKTNFIYPFYDDLVCINGSTDDVPTLQSRMKYQLSGTAPNRVLTVEWSDMRKYVSSTGFGKLQFQVKLNENGNITFHYGQVQGFDFIDANNLLFSATVGLQGKNISTTPAPGQLLLQNFAGSTTFSHIAAASTSNFSPNALKLLPSCDDKYDFVPGTSPSWVVPDTTAPSNDDVLTPRAITALGTEPTNLCNYTFTSKYAKKSDLGTYTTLLPDNATNGYADDDVWFRFQALSASTTIKMVGSGGMRPAFQVYDDVLNPISGGIKVGTTSDYGKVISLVLSSLNPGDYYMIRAYHYHGAGQAQATATISGGAVTSIAMAGGGSDYNFGSGTGITGPEVRIYGGGGTGATAYTSLTSNAVSSVTVVSGGSGYTSAPTVKIDRPGFSPTGQFGLYVFSTPVPPANNLLKNATSVTVGSGSCTPVTNQTTYAATGTTRPAGTDCSTTNPDDDVWYKFVPTEPTLTLKVTPGSGAATMDVAVQIFNAGPTNDTTTMTSLICANGFGSGGEETISGSVTVGNTYYVRVYAPASGDGLITGRFSVCLYAPTPVKYSFAQSRNTFAPITGGSVLTPSSFDDDTVSTTISPGFSFNGTTYTKVWMSTNGYIIFGNNTGITTGGTSPLSGFIGDGAVAAFAGDLDESSVSGASAEMRYQYVGNEHVFQWKDFAAYGSSDQRLNFQIRLNTTNSRVRLMYDSIARGTSFVNTQVGLRASAPTFPYFVHSRTGSNTWLNTTTGPNNAATITNGTGAGLFPGAGLTFDFTTNNIGGYPVFNGLVGTASTVNYPTFNSARVRWMPKIEATSGYYIRWRKLTDPITVATYATPTSIGTSSTDTSYTITGLKSSTGYIFDVAARAGANVSAYGPAGSFTTQAVPSDIKPGALTVPSAICAGNNVTINVPVTGVGTTPVPSGTAVRVGVIISGPASANIFQDITLSSTLTSPASQSYSAGSYTFATPGTYTLKQYVVWAGDLENSNDTASTVTTIQVGSAIATAGYKQGFNGPGLPAGYAVEYSTTGYALKLREAVNFQGTPSGTLTPQEGDSVLYFNSYSISSGNTASLYTPCFSVSDACSVFKLSLSQNSSYSTNNEGIEAYVSVDGGAYTQVQLRDSINRVLVTRAKRYDAAATAANGRWNQFRIDLGGYNGSTIKIKLVFISQFGDNFAVDNFRIDQRPGNDVGVLAIASPETNPSCASTATPVTLTVRNYGCNTQSNIPVTISYTGPAGTVTLNDQFDGPVAPGTSVTQTITTIDMTTAGTYTFNATTNLVGDGDAANDGITGYVSTVNASNLPPTITASITNNAILVGSSATFAATAPATATVSFPNNTNFLLNSTSVYTGTSITVPAAVTGTLPAAASSIAYVEVNGLTTWTGDVTLRLTAPNGSRINLIAARGGSGDNFTNTRFVPTGGAALSSASAPFTGNYAPEQAFSTLTGPLAGVWTLEGIDAALSDATNITSWSLSILNAPVTNTWTASLSNPATVAGFPFSGTNPGSKTFATSGTYQFTFTSAYANGCSNSLTRTLLVSDGNVWTGTANDQQWNTPGNWAFSPAPPSPGSAVTIPGGLGTNYPTITSSVSTANLTMGSSAKINIGSGGRLSIAGNVSGALSNITGVRAVTFTGPGVQTITGTVTLDSVTVTNTNATGLTFAAGAKLNIAPGGNLRMGTNARITVPANGALVLKSSTAGTARLLQMPASAQIIGNITMERRTPTLAGWYFVGAPVKTGTLNEWAEMGARVTPKNNSNIFEYTEPDTTRGKYNGYLTEVNGWKVPSALSNPINPTTPSLRPKGYRMFLNSTFFTQQNATLSVTGQPIVGGVTFPFTKTAAGFQGGGWNLASNPYPCEIDWQAVKTDAVAGNSSAPLGDYIQIWNTAAGAYSNYSIAVGVGTNGGSRYIPSSQAFFIRATGNGNLNFRETHKVQQANTFLRDVFPANTLRLTLSDGSHTDQSVVAFRVFGLNGRDQYDADKLNGNYLNVSTMPEPTLNLVANVMGELVAQTEIPVRVGTTSTGAQSMTLSFEGIESFDAGSSLYLRDNYLNTLTDLNQTQLYSFQITNDPASFGDSRFVLVTAPQSVTVVKTKVQPSISVWPNPAEGASQLNVRLANLGNGNAVVTMTDALGREVVRTSAALSEGTLETSLNIQALPTGVYMLRARSGSATIVKEVVIR